MSNVVCICFALVCQQNENNSCFFTDSKIPVYKTFSVLKMQHQNLSSNSNESQSVFNHFTSSFRRARGMITNVEVTVNNKVQLYCILKDFPLLMKCSFLSEQLMIPQWIQMQSIPFLLKVLGTADCEHDQCVGFRMQSTGCQFNNCRGQLMFCKQHFKLCPINKEYKSVDYKQAESLMAFVNAVIDIIL
ncbi:Hypothetical_protein [Hexamita inflata]|uniref:Hypothetical_protein n=1 Tax=Hexamita inflata TaxID=28002 RepID=A0AA86PXC2_9EUKA|nr:Hypothetical protein HINF_LOCUS33128 [Hexamita inflata]